MKEQSIIILGGGPAGMSCALWLKNYGYAPIVVEPRQRLGGMQDRSTANNNWLLGWQSVTGREVAREFARHISYLGIQLMMGCRITGLSRPNGSWRTTISDDRGERARIDSSAIVVATGTEFVGAQWIEQTPGAPICKELIEIGPAAYHEPSSWFGVTPIIVGGGDNALECAISLACRGAHPLVLVRGELSAGRVSRERLAELLACSRADLRLGVEATQLRRLEAGLLVSLSDGSAVEGTHLLLMMGYAPNTGADFRSVFGSHQPELDERGYITVDRDCRTSVDGIWAVGDVTDSNHPCTATAVAMGTIAARSIVRQLSANSILP
jgi:thioredoxin reductase (NADPH)